MDVLGGTAAMHVLRHDDQHIHIAVWSHIAAGGRAKEDNTQRVNGRNNASDQFVDSGLVRIHGQPP
jgi:hypothetical protein